VTMLWIDYLRRKPRTCAYLVVCLGLILRLQAASDWNESHPDTPARLTADEPGYDNLARGLLAGEGLTWPGRVPLYPTWVAALHYTTSYSYAAGIYIQCFLGALAVWLTFVLGRDLLGPGIGVLAAFGAAIDVILIQQSVRYLSEILFTPLVLAVALSFARAQRHPTDARFAWTGVLIGMANLVRPTLVVFPLIAVLTVACMDRRRVLRPMAILLVVSTLVVLPWLVRNYLKYHAIYPLATSNAILWQGSPEYYHLVHDERFTYLDVWNKVLYNHRNPEPGSIEGDRYWTRRALRSIAAEPGVYFRFCLEKAITYWIGDPNADWGDSFIFDYRVYRYAGFSRSATVVRLLARAFPLIVFAAFLALRPQWRRLIPVLSILAYCTALHALTHAEARLSDPLRPLLMVMFAATLCAGMPRAGETPEMKA
jgi:hypothetical protein